MTYYPGAWALSGGSNGNSISHRPADNIFHIAASSWNINESAPTSGSLGIAGWTLSSKSCHTYTDQYGNMQQYCDLFAAVNGTKDGNYRNRTHESWDPRGLTGSTDEYNTDRWTAQQCERFSDFLAWDHRVNGALLQNMHNSLPSSHGVGAHRYGVNSAGPYSRVSGGESWTSSNGKPCVPVDTEILTTDGWLALSQVTAEHLVASWSMDSGVVTFDHAATVDAYLSDTVVIAGIETTPDHDWIVLDSIRSCMCGYSGKTPKATSVHLGHANRRGENGHAVVESPIWKRVPASDVKLRQEFPTSVDAQLAGIPLSDDQLRLAVWLQADGHFLKEKRRRGDPLVIGVGWHFAKERKVRRVASLLTALDIAYSYRVQSNGTSNINVYGDEARSKVIPLLPSKRFDISWLQATRHQAAVFWAEAVNADGDSTGKDVIFSTDHESLGVIQAMSTLNGMETTSWKSGKLTWLIRRRAARKATTPVVAGADVMVGCLTTINGTLIIRQHGKVAVLGNCPGTTRVEQLDGIIARAQQLVDLGAGTLPPGRVDLKAAYARGGAIAPTTGPANPAPSNASYLATLLHWSN